jgi:hypothetical protein
MDCSQLSVPRAETEIRNKIVGLASSEDLLAKKECYRYKSVEQNLP